MYPAPFDKPFPIAKRTHDYLREIGSDERERIVVVTFPAFEADDRANAGALDDAGLSVRLPPKVGARTTQSAPS